MVRSSIYQYGLPVDYRFLVSISEFQIFQNDLCWGKTVWNGAQVIDRGISMD